MTKKIRKRKANYFADGGFEWQKGAGFGTNMSNAFNNGALGKAIGPTGSLVGQGISGGLSSQAGNIMQGLSSVASAIPGPWGAIAGAGLNIVGGLVNRAFGSQINEQAVQEAKAANTQQSNMLFAALNTADLLGQSNFGLLGNIEGSDIGKDGWFSNKAKNLTSELNRQRKRANQQALANFEATVEDLDTQNDLNALANYAAYGGPLTMRYTGTMSPFGNTFAKGGKIHIKPENKGKFTKYCGGKVTSECIAKGKRSSDPAVRKRATFAANARKWKHAFGGDLITNGADWDTGITIIGNGGTHEENPMEGVQMGMDTQGVPNLVEEGEVIFNDYVFSNRMKVPKVISSKYKLRENKGITFADAAKKIAKESEERPNDPISQRGLDAMLGELEAAQEDERFKKQMRDPEFRQQAMNQLSMQGQQYAQGGILGRRYDGEGPDDNFLNILYDDDLPDYDDTGLEPEYSIPVTDSDDVGDDKSSKMPWLRYAPVVGAAIGLGQNIFNKPDYSSSDAILDAAVESGNYTPVSANPLGDYLTYRPFDRNYYINKLNTQSSATRRAIVNQSAGNRATALAGLLTADYNAQGKLGDLARQAEEYNLGQRERVATFNRGTNQFNAEMGLKAAMANQEASLKARSQKLSGITQAMQVRDAVDARRGASMSANLTNMFNSIGDIGREAYSRNMIISNPALYYTINSDGTISYKGGFENLSEPQQIQVTNAAEAEVARRSKAKGGYLTINRR